MKLIIKIPIILGIILLLCLTMFAPQVMAQNLPSKSDLSVQKPFSSAEKQQIVQKILNNTALQLRGSGDRLRGLRVTSEGDEKGDRFSFRRSQRQAEVTLVNYNRGKAYRVLVDPNTGAIARQEELPGKPQSSLEERQEAKKIIASDPELSSLLTPGVAVEGGFAVVPPPNSDPNHRYIQMHVVSSDRRSFLRTVTLDLTASQIATSISPK